MILLYALLMISALALLWAAGACYFWVKRHLRKAETSLHGQLTEMDESDAAAV
jgi:hypothetical protein